mmetsp:Transcript_44869/g.88539  ORF Transcript_44869/g.88539 Transcript_44869/m.88539 type:complete len:523 (+) Transcript_44869:130-1698(+)
MMDKVAAGFVSAYGSPPEFIVKAPGRLNIIGEHIDYCGFGVLPMAASQAMYIACGFQETAGGAETAETETAFLQVTHLQPTQFPPLRANTETDMRIQEKHVWTNYVVAAFLGLRDEVQKGEVTWNLAGKRGLCLFVDGDVPMAAGLSSSSAMVVASAMSFAASLGLSPVWSRKELAEICAVAERYVGTSGGGMDQAAILLSKNGACQKIDFRPSLSCRPVPLPPEVSFVVANSCVEAPKASHAATHYNKRVFECRLAAFLLHRELLPSHEPIGREALPAYTLAELLETVAAQRGCGIEEAREAAVQLCCSASAAGGKVVPLADMSKAEVEKALPQGYLEALASSRIGPEVWKRNFNFSPRKRALHVLTESARVDDFIRVCEDLASGDGGGTKGTREEKLQQLGGLVNGSDESLHNLFECGCAELKELTDICRATEGVLGSRLTGAGWGGCTVSLVMRDRVGSVIDSVTSRYYEKPRTPPLWVSDDLGTYLFEASPSSGASIFIPNPAQRAWTSTEWLDKVPN